VINSLRGWTSIPILILSARGTETDKVIALDAGADDYVTKPFGIDELLARLRAAVRRFQPTGQDLAVETPHFVLNVADRSITMVGSPDTRLTPIEWQIVDALVRQPGRLVTQRRLMEQVWGVATGDTNALRVHLTHIRQKLEPDPALPRYFITETGLGYRFLPHR
jgi:DNA-binding response OmpR family regulator